MRSETFTPRDYDMFAGMDVDKRKIVVTFADHQGVLKSLRMPYSVEHLVNHVRKHFPNKKIAFAYEAGPTGYGLYDGLEAQAYRCLVASPSMIPKAPGQRVKTNRLDSRMVAQSLRGGQLKSIRVPTASYRELRHLTQLRDTFVSEMVGMKQRIKSLLLFEGIEFPPAPAGSEWSFIVKTKLRKLPCSSTVRFKLDELLDSVEFNERRVVKTTREIRRFCKEDPELSRCMKYLMTIPGIGWIVASQLLARIGDWRELRNIRELAGFLGLVPSEDSTGERTDRGSITHSGDPRLRSKLIQGSWSAIRQDGELREFFRSVCRRHPRNLAARVAIVA
ncbi:MAG TPA: IS110 family transposase, partial [Gammaproteobacteria bacterium]|nr:IS110 family transposase [Gammaproteobacteria bacterium]